MTLKETTFEGLYIVQPKVFEDPRGYFFESYNQNVFEEKGLNIGFVQDNQSLSHKGIVRGLHFQNPPHEQGKLVRVIVGAVLDVVVDIRNSSPTYGKHFSLELTDKNKLSLYIPPGFAHGFLTLKDNTIFSYKCTSFYNKPSEGCILWNDPDLNINWGVSDAVVSEKDKTGMPFEKFQSQFL